MDGTKQYEGNGCTRFVALAFQQDARPYSWSGIEETAARAYESLCQDICEGDPEDSSLFRIYVFDLKDAIERTVEDFSAAGAFYVPAKAPKLTEKEKAAIVLDEMAKSDDGKKRESAKNMKKGVDIVEAFGRLDQAESKPTGYLNGKIQTIEKRLENLFNRINEAEARLNISEQYESKVEAAEKRLDEHLAEIKSLSLLVHNIVPRVETLEKAEADRVEQQGRRDWVAANLPNPPEAPDTVAPTDEDEPPTFDNLEEAREFIECFEADCPRPWTVDRRDLICDAMGISLHAGVHFNDYIDALRTLAGLMK